VKKPPRPEDVYPPLREELKKDTELSLSLPPLMTQAMVARAQEREDAGTSGNTAEENRIRELMGQPPLLNVSNKSELQTVLQKIQDIKVARGRIAGRIQKERAIASRMVCDEVRDDVDKLGTAFADAFVALYAAQNAYHSYLEKIQDTGASIGSLPHIFITGLGSAKDKSGTFVYGMKDFIEAGYLSELPKELQ
jgi:hypothetical protein